MTDPDRDTVRRFFDDMAARDPVELDRLQAQAWVGERPEWRACVDRCHCEREDPR